MVDVIVVNHNSEEELVRCLDALEKAQRRSGEIASVTVRDNGSKQPPEKFSDSSFLFRLVIGKNIGYGAACNECAAMGHAPFLLFLNPDVEIPPAGIEAPQNVLRQYPDAGMLGISLLNRDGSVQPAKMRFPTAKQLILRSLGAGKLFPKRYSPYFEKEQLKSGRAQWVLGAYLMVRREAFEAVDGFDRKFFLYFEEVDLARRMERAGWHCRYLADLHALHLGGGSETVRAFCVRQHVKSRILYAKRYFSKKETRRLWLSAVFLEPFCRAAQAVFQGTNPITAFFAPVIGAADAARERET